MFPYALQVDDFLLHSDVSVHDEEKSYMMMLQYVVKKDN
jgi:hypothetical protein